MKKIFLIAISVFPLLVASYSSYSQEPAGDLEFPNTGAIGNTEVKNIVKLLSRNEVPSKAMRIFLADFKAISNEKWFLFTGGVLAEFMKDGVKYRVDYDKKGNWTHTIKTYTEDKLPGNIRHIVKRSYYDYDITVISEIERCCRYSEDGGYNIFYIVRMQGKDRSINLKVENEEIVELQNFLK